MDGQLVCRRAHVDKAQPHMPQGPKLRVAPPPQPFSVALVEPEIPPNTGAVARTCAATQSPLHLVGKLGFSLEEHAVRRAGLDYWHLVDVTQHASWEAYASNLDPSRCHFLTSGAPTSIFDVPLQPGDTFVFGKESTGLDAELCERHADRCRGIPTGGAVRSLNLSNAVAIVLFHAHYRAGFLSGATLAP